MTNKIAIMQPYFMPYAGYFRLFQASDTFIIYDCVQFPRRGWLHRNKMPDDNGNEQWLTLPIKKCSQDTIIKDLEFADNAQNIWDEQLDRFTIIKESKHTIIEPLRILDKTPLEYIVNLLKITCESLGIPFNVKYSSSLDIGQDVRGQDRIISIAKHFGATDYINASGGKELYDENYFKKESINLHFLPEYSGAFCSIIYEMLTDESNLIGNKLNANS